VQLLTVSKVDFISDRLDLLEKKAADQKERKRREDLKKQQDRMEKNELELYKQLHKKFEGKIQSS
jgi:hypothetical protein